MRARLQLPIAILCATVIVPSRTTLAQNDNGWHSSFTPYAWLAGMNGRLGFAGDVADVNGDALDHVDISVMALLEIKHGRWFGLLDASFVSKSDDRAVEPGSEGTVIAELDQTLLQPELGYTVVEAPWGGVDALAGGRYWHPKVNVSANTPSGPVDVASGSRSWFDGTAGVRVRVQPAERWHLYARGDAGAGGSKLTWQVAGGLNFDLSDCCSLAGMYRHIDVDYDRDALVLDGNLAGFAVGLEIRF